MVVRIFSIVLLVVKSGVGKWIAMVIDMVTSRRQVADERVASDGQLFMVDIGLILMCHRSDRMNSMWPNVVMRESRVLRVIVIMHDGAVSDLDVRIINKITGKLVPIMVSGIVMHRFAAVGMHLLVEVRVEVLAVIVRVGRVALRVIMAV